MDSRHLVRSIPGAYTGARHWAWCKVLRSTSATGTALIVRRGDDWPADFLHD